MSIMARNIAQLGQKFTENIQYEDLDYRGYLGAGTNPTLRGGAVMVNDLKLWLQSSVGDYYRRPQMGGFLDTAIHQYPLTTDGAAALTASLASAVKRQFPTINLLDLSITPDAPNRRWVMKAIIQDALTGVLAPLVTAADAFNALNG
jgi:hypothetical protein